MNTTVAKFKSTAAVNGAIDLNDRQAELDKARFDHDTKQWALQQEFCSKRDLLRLEYHARVTSIMGGE
jgi:hypothetical protein